MKIILRTAAIAALLITASCGKDSADDTAQQQQEEAEQLEQTQLEANTVSDNLLISGGTKMEGMPPAPTGSLSFDASSTSKSAFLIEGFDVNMSSDSQIVGAYIQIKAEDGTSADSYYDVNIDSNSSDNKSSKTIRKRNSKSLLAKKENDISLDVDFTAEIKPGKFCYEICVYDASGNISESEEICVKVESWGGKAEVVGKWQLVRKYVDSLPSTAQMPEVDYCESVEGSRSCAQGALNVDYNYEACERIEFFEITMNSDGTYIERYKDISNTTIGDITIPEGLTLNDLIGLCDGYSFSDSEAVLTYDGDGKWSYIDDEDKFVFVEYNYEEVYDDESYTDSNEPGRGYLYYGAGDVDGEVKLVNGKLIISSFEWNTSEFQK